MEFYRGGDSLKPTSRDVRVDPITGFLKNTRGVSVFSRPDGLDRFGGAYRLTNVPPELSIIQRGANPTHYEIVPATAMTLTEYEEALNKITLVPA
jgi:hypothetical protein